MFTLIAVAMMAMGANAQEKILFDASGSYADGQEFTTANLTLKLGNDFDTWKVNMSAIKEGQYADFKQTVTIDGVDKDGIVIISGNQNPKDKAAKNTGSGFDATDGKSVGRLPQSGAYFVLSTKAAGSVAIGVSINPDKEFYLIDATNAAVDAETGEFLEVALPESRISDFVIKDVDGNEVTPSVGGKNGAVLGAKVVGTIEFTAQANKTYYYFCTGSKLGCFGVVFTAGEDSGISTVKAEKTSATYNLAGQKVGADYKGLVIQNGRKYVK